MTPYSKSQFVSTLIQTLLLGCALLSVSVEVLGQQDDEVVRVNTELVVMNVTVTDKAGEYVPGLRLSDFKVFEDGKEVPATLISNFGVHESPFASVVLLDTSASMESRLSLGRSAAIRFLDGLRPEDVAAVYKFDYKVEQVQEFSSGRDLAPMAFTIKARGMTTLYDAILEAVNALTARQEPRKAIVVLSDGMDTYSKTSSSKALEAAMAVGASIYTVDMSATDAGAAQLAECAGVEGLRREKRRTIYRDPRWASFARCVCKHREGVGTSVHDRLSTVESGARRKMAVVRGKTLPRRSCGVARAKVIALPKAEDLRLTCNKSAIPLKGQKFAGREGRFTPACVSNTQPHIVSAQTQAGVNRPSRVQIFRMLNGSPVSQTRPQGFSESTFRLASEPDPGGKTSRASSRHPF